MSEAVNLFNNAVDAVDRFDQFCKSHPGKYPSEEESQMYQILFSVAATAAITAIRSGGESNIEDASSLIRSIVHGRGQALEAMQDAPVVARIHRRLNDNHVVLLGAVGNLPDGDYDLIVKADLND